MYKVILKVQESTKQGHFQNYKPDSITLSNYSARNLSRLEVILRTPVGNLNLYMAPELLKGGLPTEESCVFNMGIIWDELLHDRLYFQNEGEILSETCKLVI